MKTNFANLRNLEPIQCGEAVEFTPKMCEPVIRTLSGTADHILGRSREILDTAGILHKRLFGSNPLEEPANEKIYPDCIDGYFEDAQDNLDLLLKILYSIGEKI